MATEYHQQTLSNLRVEKDYYTTAQISELFHVSKATACNWCRKGWLQADREQRGKSSGRGGKWKVRPQCIEDVELRKEELIELSRKYWVRLLAKMR